LHDQNKNDNKNQKHKITHPWDSSERLAVTASPWPRVPEARVLLAPEPPVPVPAPAPRSLADMDWRELILIRSLAGVILARLADLCPPRLALGRFALAMGVWVLL